MLLAAQGRAAKASRPCAASAQSGLAAKGPASRELCNISKAKGRSRRSGVQSNSTAPSASSFNLSTSPTFSFAVKFCHASPTPHTSIRAMAETYQSTGSTDVSTLGMNLNRISAELAELLGGPLVPRASANELAAAKNQI